MSDACASRPSPFPFRFMNRIWLRTFGIDLRRMLCAARSAVRYLREERMFRARMTDASFGWGRRIPILDERDQPSGSLGAYFHQDLLVARWVRDAAPRRHIDVGSRIDGFIGHLAVFREVEVLDIRPQSAVVPNVRFHRVDLTGGLPGCWHGAADSVSCLHTIEHFGLGRYGDAIDPQGHEAGLRQLRQMVGVGGMLYLSTPMGPQRVEFNAHRIFAASTILGWFADGWEIEKFAFIDDGDVLHEDPERSGVRIAENFGCDHGVGIVAARRLR